MKGVGKDGLGWRIKAVALLMLPAIVCLFVWRWWKYEERQDVMDCKYERTLHFEGVVSRYEGDLVHDRISFYLNDTEHIMLHRSPKEVRLHDGDTIIKHLGVSTYIIRKRIYYSTIENGIDTITFHDCDSL